MDNNNFPQGQNMNNQPQQPFNPNPQPQQPFQPQQNAQQPFNAQPQQSAPQQPFNAQPQQPVNNPFGGGHHHNTQPNNPFMSSFNNNANLPNDPQAHQKGLISVICGAASILFNIIAIVSACTCSASFGTNPLLNYNDLTTGTIISGVLVFLALAAGVVGIVMAATGKKTSNESIITAGLVLSIVGTVLILISFIVCACTCTAACGVNSASSSLSSLSSYLY